MKVGRTDLAENGNKQVLLVAVLERTTGTGFTDFPISSSSNTAATNMADSQRKETDAFFSFFASFDLARPVTTVSDLSDGAALVEILSTM